MIILILKDQYSTLGMCETEGFSTKNCDVFVHANTGGEDRVFVVVRELYHTRYSMFNVRLRSRFLLDPSHT